MKRQVPLTAYKSSASRTLALPMVDADRSARVNIKTLCKKVKLP